MEENVLHQNLITALRQGNYTIKKSEALSLKDIDLDEIGDIDSQDLDWVEIEVFGIHPEIFSTIIEDFTVYYELKSLQPRKTIISDTEFDNDTLTFFDSEGVEAISITEKDVIEIIKKNIKQKLVQQS